jgi:hypothetical protein
MTTKAEMIKIIEAENPEGLKVGNDQDGYVELSALEYQEQIEKWAQARLAKEAGITEAEAKAAQKAALLDRLGITEDEAKLLLA